jgi:hypothetical protein
MRSLNFHQIIGTIGAAAALCGAPALVLAQTSNDARLVAANGDVSADDEAPVTYKFKSRADSLSWEKFRAAASRSTGFRIVVSLSDAHVWAIVGEDTVLSAPAAVAKGTTLKYGKSTYRFVTPRGTRTVLGKEADPIWQPPEWLYVETALEHDLKLDRLYIGKPVKLRDGRLLTVKDGLVGLIENGEFAAMPTDEHIVFDGKLYIPPLGTENRKVEGELGKYRLILGDGFLLHGTPYKDSIGLAATHGCVRLRDEDIEWLYEHVPVGTKVYIY